MKWLCHPPLAQTLTYTHTLHTHTYEFNLPCGEREDWEKIDLPLCGVLRGLKPLRMHFVCWKTSYAWDFIFFLVKSNTHCPSLACNSNLLREDVIRHFAPKWWKYFFFRNIKPTAFCRHIISPVWTTLWISINANVTTIDENLDVIH